MDSSLTKACTIKLTNFEGPFDLLFHLIEINKVNIYDIPINEITDQYMEYLFAAKELNLEIASEFLVMAATLLHIKSRMLLPERKDKEDDGVDPREELVNKLIEYKKFKSFSQVIKGREKEWETIYYKLPEIYDFEWEDEILELSPELLAAAYTALLNKNESKINRKVGEIQQILMHEKVSIKNVMREVLEILLGKKSFRFSHVFSFKNRSKTEIVTGFIAILELSKLKRTKIEQPKQFADIYVHKVDFEITGLKVDDYESEFENLKL